MYISNYMFICNLNYMLKYYFTIAIIAYNFESGGIVKSIISYRYHFINAGIIQYVSYPASKTRLYRPKLRSDWQNSLVGCDPGDSGIHL